MPKKSYSDILKIILDEKKMSKYELAKRVGVSWNSMNFWVRGIYAPDKNNYEKLLKVYEQIKRS